MRAVAGNVTSRKPISLEKASPVVSRFTGFAAGAARSDVAAHLRRTAAAFKELLQFHNELRGGRNAKRQELESRGVGEGDDGSEKSRKKTKRRKTDLDYGRDGGVPPHHGGSGASAEPPKAKQCDGGCGASCDNARIYISNLPFDATTDELTDLFGGIDQVIRIKRKRGYEDEVGKNKGQAFLTYEDPSSAHSAGGFYDGYDMRGHKISVTMAEKTTLNRHLHTGFLNSGGGGANPLESEVAANRETRMDSSSGRAAQMVMNA